MSPPFESTFWGVVSGGAPVLGAVVACSAKVPARVIAGVTSIEHEHLLDEEAAKLIAERVFSGAI